MPTKVPMRSVSLAMNEAFGGPSPASAFKAVTGTQFQSIRVVQTKAAATASKAPPQVATTQPPVPPPSREASVHRDASVEPERVVECFTQQVAGGGAANQDHAYKPTVICQSAWVNTGHKFLEYRNGSENKDGYGGQGECLNGCGRNADDLRVCPQGRIYDPGNLVSDDKFTTSFLKTGHKFNKEKKEGDAFFRVSSTASLCLNGCGISFQDIRDDMKNGGTSCIAPTESAVAAE